ncbi:MAG: restriction endonuclease [Parcubacteria group bacterium]|jgi:hypothetical protein|nr:restriction endonuclease [Parcubacteria group bacterium]
MRICKRKVEVFGKECVLELMSFSNSDRKKWMRLFNTWKRLKLGLRGYKSREPNFPEGLSEVAFCLFSDSERFVSSKGSGNSSFDTFNVKKNRAEQIKASSIKEDLTSFGPKSKWDDLYFLDFYNNGKLDGSFNVYKIPTDKIYSVKVNKSQNFKQQQAQDRRPRFSITKKIIKKYNLKPIGNNIQILK